MLKNLIYKIFGKPTNLDFDTGLRGTTEGKLYVDKKVFYMREDVRAEIEKVKNSEVIKQMIERYRRKW
jgi:hypothetical protein